MIKRLQMNAFSKKKQTKRSNRLTRGMKMYWLVKPIPMAQGFCRFSLTTFKSKWHPILIVLIPTRMAIITMKDVSSQVGSRITVTGYSYSQCTSSFTMPPSASPTGAFSLAVIMSWSRPRNFAYTKTVWLIASLFVAWQSISVSFPSTMSITSDFAVVICNKMTYKTKKHLVIFFNNFMNQFPFLKLRKKYSGLRTLN